MTYQDFLSNLPINSFHRIATYEDWWERYSPFYPTEEERKEIYRLDDWVSSLHK